MATTLTPKKVNQLSTTDALREYSSTTGERERFATAKDVLLVVRQSGTGDDGSFFVQIENDGNTPHNFVARADDTVIVETETADLVEIPDVKTQTTADATTALEAAGFVVDAQLVNTNDATDGTVFIQYPGPPETTSAPVGTKITIYSAVAVV